MSKKQSIDLFWQVPLDPLLSLFLRENSENKVTHELARVAYSFLNHVEVEEVPDVLGVDHPKWKIYITLSYVNFYH